MTQMPKKNKELTQGGKTYLDGTEKDVLVVAYIETYQNEPQSHVIVRYGTREQATVPPRDLVRRQVTLLDGRLLRVDSVSPQGAMPHTIIVTTEMLGGGNRGVAEIPGHPRFVDNGDGTTIDTVTGLMWQQTVDAPMTWDKAVSYAGALDLVCYGDWRLPSMEELQLLVRSIGDYDSMNTVFPPPASSSPYYWSSSTHCCNTGTLCGDRNRNTKPCSCPSLR